MKRLQLAVLLILFTQVLTAQDYKFVLSQINWTPIQYNPSKKVKEIKFTNDYGKGPASTYIRKYEEGKMVSIAYFDKKGKAGWKSTFLYNSHGWLTKRQSTYKGEITFAQNYDYTHLGKLILQQSLNKNGAIRDKTTWAYDKKDRLVERVQYGRRGITPKYISKTEYQDDGKRAKSYYYKKDKLLKEWTYECDAEGRELKKKETQVCQWEESNDSHLLKIYQSRGSKGRVYKSIWKYTLPDTAIVEYTRKYNDTILSNKHTFAGDFNKPLSIISYKKGRVYTKSDWEYDGELTKNYTHQFRRKLITRLEYKYGDELLEKLFQYKKGKLYKTTNITYEL